MDNICAYCNLDTAGNHQIDCQLHPNNQSSVVALDATIEAPAHDEFVISSDCKLNFGNQRDHVDCETPGCDNDISIPSKCNIIVICLKAMQEGWYINDKGQFLCPECKNKLIGDEMPKTRKVIITTNLIYDVMKVKFGAERPLLKDVPIVHYADEQDANIAKMNYRDKGYEVKMVLTEAGVEELLKGEQE